MAPSGINWWIIQANGWKNIGLLLGSDSYEYPLWKVLGDNGYTIKHVNVDNETAIYEDKSFVPDCIIVVGNNVSTSDYECHGVLYHSVYKYSDDYCIITK